MFQTGRFPILSFLEGKRVHMRFGRLLLPGQRRLDGTFLFSPRFGQSYYEIFTRGNYDHNVVFTTPFNAPSMRQMVTADFRISAHSALRLGYRADIQQSKLHDLKFHEWSPLFVLGFVKSFTLTPRHL